MDQSGAQIAAKLAKAADGGEDRLSALPDEVLVLILECLDTTAEAARTSVLARRWRGLCPLLSKLNFQLRPDGDRIRALLDVADAPQLRDISVTTEIGADAADSAAATAWLPAAARRLAGGLVYHNMATDLECKKAWTKRGASNNIQLPCFENATRIELHLRCLGGLVLPSLGVFTRLTDLDLRYVWFRGPCELGDLVSSPRCPCLQKLSIGYSCGGLDNLSIHSDSLLQIDLIFCNLRRQLTVVTPLLQKLSVQYIFLRGNAAGDDQSERQGANITAPKMVSLVWKDRYDPRYFHLCQPRKLETQTLYVYGLQPQTRREYNRSVLRLLQQFKVLDTLHLPLIYFKQDVLHYQYLLGDIKVLPQITFLQLDLIHHWHSVGASLFHVLRLCTGLTRLSLVLYGCRSNLEACPSGCFCGQPTNWKTDQLVLDHLEDVHINGLRGAKHEVALVQRFLSWATVLKSLRITLVNKTTKAEKPMKHFHKNSRRVENEEVFEIGEFREALAGSFRPETCAQFDTNDSK